MSLNAELLKNVYSLLKNQYLTEDQAQRLVDAYGEREELLAALIVEPNTLSQHDGLKEKLLMLVSHHYVRHQTPRTEVGDLAAIRDAKDLVTSDVLALIKDCQNNLPLSNKAHASLRKQALSFQGQKDHPGYHWCVKAEKGSDA